MAAGPGLVIGLAADDAGLGGGQQAFSADVADVLADQASGGATPLQELTPREFEVLRMLAHGNTAADIAGAMHLSTKTIFNYLSLIRQKLGADSDFKLLHLAARHGMVGMRKPLGA